MSFPKPLIVVPLAAFLGLALGVILALLAEALDRRIRAKEDLEFVTQAPFLGETGGVIARQPMVWPRLALRLPLFPWFDGVTQRLDRRRRPCRPERRGSRVSARHLNILIAIVAILSAAAAAQALIPRRLLAERITQAELASMIPAALPGWKAVPDIQNRRRLPVRTLCPGKSTTPNSRGAMSTPTAI